MTDRPQGAFADPHHRRMSKSLCSLHLRVCIAVAAFLLLWGTAWHLLGPARARMSILIAGVYGNTSAEPLPAKIVDQNEDKNTRPREVTETDTVVHDYDDLPDIPTDMALNKGATDNPFDRKVRGADVNTVALKPRMSALYHGMARAELIALCVHRLQKYATYLGIESVDAYVQKHAPQKGMELNMRYQVCVGVHVCVCVYVCMRVCL
jgi:hypothetical protein